MLKRVFGRRQSETSSSDRQVDEAISQERLDVLEHDYLRGYMDGGLPATRQRPRAFFWTAAFRMFDGHGLVQANANVDFTTLPVHVAAQLSRLHLEIMGAPAAAQMAQQAAAATARQSEIALVSGQIDLIEVLDQFEARGGKMGRRFSERLLDWLKLQSPDPDLWHDIATGADPDGMDEVFEWIVQQPDCDVATAAHIFHVSNAYDLFDYPDDKAAGMYDVAFRNVVTIIDRWQAGSFPTARFSFEPDGRPEPLEIYVAAAEKAAVKFGKAPFHVPATLLELRQGERTRSKYFFNGQLSKTKYLAMLAEATAR